jgi:hypothetical protein
MPWKIHFNGQMFGPVSDADYDTIASSIRTAAQNGDVAVFGTELDGARIDGIWTTGAPISFEHVDEAASDPEFTGIL